MVGLDSFQLNLRLSLDSPTKLFLNNSFQTEVLFYYFHITLGPLWFSTISINLTKLLAIKSTEKEEVVRVNHTIEKYLHIY